MYTLEVMPVVSRIRVKVASVGRASSGCTGWMPTWFPRGVSSITQYCFGYSPGSRSFQPDLTYSLRLSAKACHQPVRKVRALTMQQVF